MIPQDDAPERDAVARRAIVVIPTFNDGPTVGDIARRAARFCPVIVVDDGSSDDTAERLAGAPVTVLRNKHNSGKAASLWRGMQAALAREADAVVTLDADGQHVPEEIPRLLEAAVRQPDRIIIATRSIGREHTPPLRLFANRMANFWISWAAGYPISDSQSGFRLYPAALLQRLGVPVDRSRCFVFESEVLIEAAHLGWRSLAVPIRAIYHEDRRPSHYRATADTLRIIRMVAWKLIRRGIYPQGLYRSLTLPRE
jgi:glycosyltransferase involved in cell wall biosynthesis